jgi:hypothetical protein
VDPRTSQTGTKPARLSKKARSRAEAAAAEPAAEA